MSTIRLEHDQFAAAPALADVLTDRLLTVAPAAGDSGVGGDLKSTTLYAARPTRPRSAARKPLWRAAEACAPAR